jgi:hypothetical protein
MNPDIKAALFKRIETEDYAVVPLVKYSIVSYRLLSFTSPSAKPPPLPKYHLVVDVNSANIADVLEYVDSEKGRYEFWALTNTGNLEGLLLGGVLYGYVVVVRGVIRGLYVFRDSRISLDDGGPLLELAASVNGLSSPQVFYDGFLQAVFLFSKQYPFYKTLSIENLGDNEIIENLYPAEHYIMGVTGAYYFYNYFYRTVAGSQCFILL